MNLVKCRHCYGYIAPDAKTCLNCGTANPVGGGGEGALAIAGFLALMLGLPVAIGVAVLVFWGAPPKEDGVRSFDYVVTMFTERMGRFRELMSPTAAPKWTPGSWSSALPRSQCDHFVTAEERVECLIEDDRNRPNEDPYAAKRTDAQWRALAKADPCAGYSTPIAEMECRQALGIMAAPEEKAQDNDSAGREHVALPLSKPAPPRLTAAEEALRNVALKDWSWRQSVYGPALVSGLVVNDSDRHLTSMTVMCAFYDKADNELRSHETLVKRRLLSTLAAPLENVDLGAIPEQTNALRCMISEVTVD